jgi:hypothetical protein
MPGPVGCARGATSRRQLLGRTLAGVGAISLAGAAAASAQSLPALAPDAQVLGHLLDVERRLIAAYRSVIAAEVLNVFAAARVSGLLDQEHEHMTAIEMELGRLGTPQTLALPAPVLAPHTMSEALGLLLIAETAAESAYTDAVARLQDARLVGVTVEILASEAQHWTLLSVLLRPDDLAAAVPSAFVGD